MLCRFVGDIDNDHSNTVARCHGGLICMWHCPNTCTGFSANVLQQHAVSNITTDRARACIAFLQEMVFGSSMRRAGECAVHFGHRQAQSRRRRVRALSGVFLSVLYARSARPTVFGNDFVIKVTWRRGEPRAWWNRVFSHADASRRSWRPAGARCEAQARRSRVSVPAEALQADAILMQEPVTMPVPALFVAKHTKMTDGLCA